MYKTNKIYLLIGNKGSGKSFIGGLFEKYFSIKFVRVEDWAKTIKRGRAISNENYIQEVFEAIENGITRKAIEFNSIVFESTGLTEHFDKMYNNLNAKFNLISIKIETDLSICLDRVKTRDQSIHINVSDEQVVSINKAVEQKKHACRFVIENSNKTEEQLVNEIKLIIDMSK